MSITIEHGGYEIAYIEADNLWRCNQLDMEASSLSAVRELIDKAETDTQLLNVPAFLLDHSGFSITPVMVVSIDRDGKSAWVINKVDDPKNFRKEKVSLHRIVEDTPENRGALLNWRDASRAIYEEGQRVAQMRDEIPRMDGTTPHERPD